MEGGEGRVGEAELRMLVWDGGGFVCAVEDPVTGSGEAVEEVEGGEGWVGEAELRMLVWDGGGFVCAAGDPCAVEDGDGW